MESTAKVLRLPAKDGYQVTPDAHTRVKGNGRAIAVAKFRELADKLESGELDGARVQWLDTHGEPESGLEFVTRSAYREDGSGEVKLRTLTIEEV